MMIGDVVSPLTFLGILELLNSMGDVSKSMLQAVEDFRGAHDEVATIGEWIATEESESTPPSEQVWMYQKLATSSGLPRRWKLLLAEATIGTIVSADSSELAINATRALYYMLPGIDFTPGSAVWWHEALKYLQTPLQVKDSILSVAEDFHALVVGEFRRRMRKPGERASGSRGAGRAAGLK